MDAIAASTANAAKLLGWSNWLGTIEPGKVADLVVLNKNPLDDLRALSTRDRITMVLQEGRIVSRQHQHIESDAATDPFVCCGHVMFL